MTIRRCEAKIKTALPTAESRTSVWLPISPSCIAPEAEIIEFVPSASKTVSNGILVGGLYRVSERWQEQAVPRYLVSRLVPCEEGLIAQSACESSPGSVYQQEGVLHSCNWCKEKSETK